jgi:hypothetical protein
MAWNSFTVTGALWAPIYPLAAFGDVMALSWDVFTQPFTSRCMLGWGANCRHPSGFQDLLEHLESWSGGRKEWSCLLSKLRLAIACPPLILVSSLARIILWHQDLALSFWSNLPHSRRLIIVRFIQDSVPEENPS